MDAMHKLNDQVTLANWRRAPFNQWSFQHVRELVPSADIANDPGAVRALPSVPVVMTSPGISVMYWLI